MATSATVQGRTVTRAALVGAALAALVLGAVLGVLGDQLGRAAGPAVHVGGGYAGASLASLHGPDGWVSVKPGVVWFDQDGVRHDDGMPSCLSRLGPVRDVRWADASVSTPGGGSVRVIAWVDCRRSD